MLKFHIEGKPHPHTTHRCGCRGRKPVAYPAATNEPWRTLVRRQGRKHRPKYPMEGPLVVDQDYRLPRPKSHFRSNGELRADAPEFPLGKHTGDRDNYMKDTQDVLTELEFWGDDSQIVDGRETKLFADDKHPKGVTITIKKYNGKS